jgi:uncharacterized protein YaeQ
MAQSSTVHVFELTVSDVDRGVYEAVTVKAARHPSESMEYLATRVLAYALELQEGLAFSHGLGAAEEPALWVRDLTGQLQAWIEVGTPDAARLHRASKACGRVVVYCHKDPGPYLRGLAGAAIHAPERVSIVPVDRAFIAALVARIDRRTALAVSVTEGQVYVDVGGASLSLELAPLALPG